MLLNSFVFKIINQKDQGWIYCVFSIFSVNVTGFGFVYRFGKQMLSFVNNYS